MGSIVLLKHNDQLIFFRSFDLKRFNIICQKQMYEYCLIYTKCHIKYMQ